MVDLAAAGLDRLVGEFRHVGGPERLAQQVSRFVEQRYPALSECRRSVLCDHDFVDGNLMVDIGPPRISGMFDLERESWETRCTTSRRRSSSSVTTIRGGCPRRSTATASRRTTRRFRLQAYQSLHLRAERCWIRSDRPHGWQRSIAALDDLRALLR